MTVAKFTYAVYLRTKRIADFYFKRAIAHKNPNRNRDLATYGKWRDRETTAFNVWMRFVFDNDPVSKYGL